MRSHPILIVAGVLLAACGPDTDPETNDTTTVTDPPNKADNEALAACGAEICSGGSQKIEGNMPYGMSDMTCVLEAMRDRKPGLYRVEQNHTWTNGSDTATFTLLVTVSGEAAVGVHRFGFLDATEEESWDPTERCSLASAAFFDGCLAAVQAGGDILNNEEAWACVYPAPAEGHPWYEQELPWFESCEAQAPTCE